MRSRNAPCLEMAAPPSPQPAVAKGDTEEEWLTGVLGGEAHFLLDRAGTDYGRKVAFTDAC